MTLATTLSAAFTIFFLFIVASYYVLFFRKVHRGKQQRLKSITVVIPAHNEARFIGAAIESVLAATWHGTKKIVVVCDGCTDGTEKIAKRYPVTVLVQKHTGKSASINRVLATAKTDLLAVVDGDSTIAPNALAEAVTYFDGKRVAAVSAVITVKTNHTLFSLWLHVEQLYASLTRSLLSRINANITASGPLTVFRVRALKSIDGFGTKGYAEDVDIALRLIRAGYLVRYSDGSRSETNMPQTIRGFIAQRARFAKGAVNIIRRHFKADHTLTQIYTLPLFCFGYFQAVIMGALTLINLVVGYHTYFLAKGMYFNWYVVKYFIEWLTLVGVVHWGYNLATGAAQLTILAGISIAATLLSYPLYFVAIIRYDHRVTFKHLIAILFLPLFWLLVMTTYVSTTSEWFVKHQENRWQKAH